MREPDRVARLRTRVSTTVVGDLGQRYGELKLMNQAWILSALTLMMFVPALIAMGALLPLGSEHGLAAAWARHLGLSRAAAHDVRLLFRSDHTVQGASTVIGSLVTIVFAYSWPAELQRSYETMWGLPSRGFRDVWRALVWLIVFLGLVAIVASSGKIAAGTTGSLVTGLVGAPVLFAWSWWAQHLLLGGRVRYRLLIPGAIATTIAIVGFSVTMSVYLSDAIVSNYDKYGAIGVVFALLSWMIGLSFVLLLGPLAGHTYARRHGMVVSCSPDDAAGEPSRLGQGTERPEEIVMSTLIAIGYPDEATATAASDVAQRLSKDLILEADAIAVVSRDREGKYHVTTNHHEVAGGATWGMFWGLLFGLLFFVPVFGMAVGAGLGSLMGKVAKTGIDKQFQDQVREMIQPGTSALFLVIEKVTPDKAIDALSEFGGTVLKSSLSKKAEEELQRELSGETATA